MEEVIYQKKEKMRNINRVYWFISQNKFFTKKEIADSLNISFPTVTKIINLLLEKKIVIDKGYSKHNVKRKASLYEYNPNSFYSIGIILFLRKQQKALKESFYSTKTMWGHIDFYSLPSR